MARTINKVELLGRVGTDPEMKYTQGGTAVTQLRLATDRHPPERRDEHGLAQHHLLVRPGRSGEPVCRQRGPALHRRQTGPELV